MTHPSFFRRLSWRSPSPRLIIPDIREDRLNAAGECLVPCMTTDTQLCRAEGDRLVRALGIREQ